MQNRLAVRIDERNADHHLWKNHGTWWIHYTLHLDEHRARRVRHSLGTSDLAHARRLRDELFAAKSCSLLGGAR